ncbi:MAG: hypothetical protein ACOYMD_06365 [Paludibacter sp.]
MKKITTLFIIFFLTIGFVQAKQGGVLTSNPTPIIPNQSVTINYDGAGTNFVTWTPMCYIHAWLNPISGQTFSKSYSTPWSTCAGDADYTALDAKLKMTHDGVANSGKYSITIADLTAFFTIASEDISKIGTLGIIVKTQWSTNEANNVTNDFLLTVGEAAVGSDKFNFAYGVDGQPGWTFLDLTKDEINTNQYEVNTTITDLTGLSCYVGWNNGGFGNPTWTNTGGGLSKTVLLSSVSNARTGNVWIIINKTSTADNWDVNFPLNTSKQDLSKNELKISCSNNILKADFVGFANIELFSISGQLLRTAYVENQFTELVKNGAYLLRVNGKTFKLLAH